MLLPASSSPSSSSNNSTNEKRSTEMGSQDTRHSKRLKVGRACYTCRAKKIKCDGLRPCMQVDLDTDTVCICVV
ncbi:predicted protein [Lichtheimia corymbifera JMRC:FSU:9682]|uniref:Zn(2)-C6 fungal-type domain-containing protein n=1 Tax=Lichtheimia corymbifera JMRC:FSU:9682 TaxID=1263082 RepID=A0A068RZT1_9FUNG|nr:predicted protein [Lichtheimia corymbifera JMRC:FSU:9682]